MQKGTYVIDFKAPADAGVEYNNAWLYSVTDGVKVSQGQEAYTNTGTTWSGSRYTVTLTEPHTYKIQHYFQKANTYGLGYKCQSGVSIYSQVDIQKVGTGGASSGGDSIWTDVDGDAVLETDGKKLTIDANVAELGAKARITTDTPSLEFKVGSGGLPDMTIGGTGVISAQGIYDLTTNAVAPNVCVDGGGVLRRSTVATYSAEEVDARLAIKDKLIEKLSARLDALEKRVK